MVRVRRERVAPICQSYCSCRVCAHNDRCAASDKRARCPRAAVNVDRGEIGCPLTWVGGLRGEESV